MPADTPSKRSAAEEEKEVEVIVNAIVRLLPSEQRQQAKVLASLVAHPQVKPVLLSLSRDVGPQMSGPRASGGDGGRPQQDREPASKLTQAAAEPGRHTGADQEAMAAAAAVAAPPLSKPSGKPSGKPEMTAPTSGKAAAAAARPEPARSIGKAAVGVPAAKPVPGPASSKAGSGKAVAKAVAGGGAGAARKEAAAAAAGEAARIPRAKSAKPGEFVAVRCEDPDYPYYLLLVERPLKKLKKAATDGYGNKFPKDSKVLQGRWLQYAPGNSSSSNVKKYKLEEGAAYARPDQVLLAGLHLDVGTGGIVTLSFKQHAEIVDFVEAELSNQDSRIKQVAKGAKGEAQAPQGKRKASGGGAQAGTGKKHKTGGVKN